MKIEVVYALPMDQHSVMLDLPDGTSAEEALARSGLLKLFPEIAGYAIGTWGRAAKAGDRLRDGDRVEIYRPLVADPKEARRRRAAVKAKGPG